MIKNARCKSAAVFLIKGPLYSCFLGLTTAQWKRAVQVISEALNREFIKGVKIAADVASDYDKYSTHGFLVSDCILGKLNVKKGKIRKNKAAEQMNAMISSIEKKVDSVGGMMRFMVGVEQWKRTESARKAARKA